MTPSIERDFRKIAELHPDGLTSQQVMRFFKDHGIKVSESTFRKYVQLGLLPRSRRVGQKGRHKGSRGIYPHRILERVWSIRVLMDEGYTIDEIQKGVMRFRGRIDDVERSLEDLFTEFGKELDGPRFDSGTKKTASRELRDARKTAQELIRRLEGVEKKLVETKPAAASDEEELYAARASRRFF